MVDTLIPRAFLLGETGPWPLAFGPWMEAFAARELLFDLRVLKILGSWNFITILSGRIAEIARDRNVIARNLVRGSPVRT